MNPPPGLVTQGPQSHQPQLSVLAASNNPQAQLNTFIGNGPNNFNQLPFMPGPSFLNGSNMAFNTLMMQNGLFGIQNMQCQPPNFNAVAGLPFQGQLYNAAQNLNQIAGQQFQGQFNLQGLCPQSFPQNMNQIICLMQGQMNSQNAVAPMPSILPQQCSVNPFGSAQATPSSNHMFSQFTAASPCPNNFLLNAVQLQAVDQQISATTTPQNPQTQFPHPPQPHQNLKNVQRCQDIVTEKSGNEVLNANLGSERQAFTPHPRGNWNKGNSQTRFLKPRFDHMANGRGGVRSFQQNRGNGPRNMTQKKPNMEAYDNQPNKPRRCSLSYTEEEIQQWREARRKNYPTASKTAKKLGEICKNLALNDEDAKARRKQLRDILAKQAELGVEVAELPHNYLSDPENQPCNRNYRNNFRGRGKPYNGNGRFQNKFNKRGRATHDDSRYIKRNNTMDGEFRAPVAKRVPTLLQKLLRSDIKKDNSKLLQVFRFITLNSFFECWPKERPIFPQVTAKDAPFAGDTGVGTFSGAHSGFDTLKAEENTSNTKDLTGEDVSQDIDRDEDIGSEADNNSDGDDCELSDKSEDGEI